MLGFLTSLRSTSGFVRLDESMHDPLDKHPPHQLEVNEGLVALGRILMRLCTSSVAHTKCVVILTTRTLQVFWSKLWSIVGIDYRCIMHDSFRIGLGAKEPKLLDA